MTWFSDLTGLLPPALRRTAAGAWLDLRGLPHRLRDPARWGEPLQALHNVGGGDFDRMGHALLAQLREHAGLRPDSAVLDIGCGTGRLAAPLAGYLSPGAGYVGFDVSQAAINACRRRIGRRRADFTFVRADILNPEYNPNGQVPEPAYVFPAADGSIDVAAAFSVFSHMSQASIRHYLAQAARVLRAGGRVAFTGYALTPARLDALGRGEGRLPFRPWRDGAMVIDARSPERAIAHPLAVFEAALQDSGLEPLCGPRQGSWLGAPSYDGFQDLFVAIRK